MLIELNYVLFSLLLAMYCAWRYFARREKHLRYLTFGFAFLTLSTALHMISSLIWVHSIQSPIILIRLLELGGLGFFASFIVTAIMALKKIGAKHDSTETNPAESERKQ